MKKIVCKICFILFIVYTNFAYAEEVKRIKIIPDYDEASYIYMYKGKMYFFPVADFESLYNGRISFTPESPEKYSVLPDSLLYLGEDGFWRLKMDKKYIPVYHPVYKDGIESGWEPVSYPSGEIVIVMGDSRTDTLYDYKNNGTSTYKNYSDIVKSDIVNSFFPTSTKISSSKFLTENIDGKIIKYAPENLFVQQSSDDGHYEEGLSWLPLCFPWVEGERDSGIGAFIEIEYKYNKVNAISVLNGYVDPHKMKLFKENNRVKTMTVIDVDNKTQFDVDFEDYVYYKDIKFSKPTSHIKLVIKDVYKGTKYDDTCISAIRVPYIDADLQNIRLRKLQESEDVLKKNRKVVKIQKDVKNKYNYQMNLSLDFKRISIVNSDDGAPWIYLYKGKICYFPGDQREYFYRGEIRKPTYKAFQADFVKDYAVKKYVVLPDSLLYLGEDGYWRLKMDKKYFPVYYENYLNRDFYGYYDSDAKPFLYKNGEIVIIMGDSRTDTLYDYDYDGTSKLKIFNTFNDLISYVENNSWDPNFAEYKNISSSKYLTKNVRGKTIEYAPANLLVRELERDKKEIRLSWAPVTVPWAEGEEGSGIGAFIEVKFDYKWDVIAVLNGYVDPHKMKLFKENNRVKTMTVIDVDNKTQFDVDFEDYVYYKDIKFSKPTSHIKLIIKDVYKGTKYDDTCISAIRVGYESERERDFQLKWMRDSIEKK